MKKAIVGIGLTQQTSKMHIVGAVHERPDSTQTGFRIRLGAFTGRSYYRRAIRESPLRSYTESCGVKPIPTKAITIDKGNSALTQIVSI